ncbi:citrate/2-methylcitrate synthase [Pseudoramibacter alactolyticus]|uniref:citrate/2-methylcitrate synthase n=1 Tax=Pseudoramibacter alactolyticus TaxID=113287 RepID=UPI0028E1B009|nr:citrate/2-methylcitrate synthase [Pseudoramibacter alactolyticus]
MMHPHPIIEYTKHYADICKNKDQIPEERFQKYHVNRGLRDQKGNGVLVGLTNISRVDGFDMIDGKRVPCEGKLWYRGYNAIELIKGLGDSRYGFEEAAYLLLFGDLPNAEQLRTFNEMLVDVRTLPSNFARDIIMKAPSRDLMNSITRSVLTLASYDPWIGDPSLGNVLRQCMALISAFPMLAVYGYHAYNHYINDGSLYIHRPRPELSTAENLLMMLRPDKQYTELEAHVLDIALILHMEHGGGNNSTFTTRAVTSAGSDTYSVVAAALSSLKGSKHGGANLKVVEMMRDLKTNVGDITDKEAVETYLRKLLAGKAFDRKGLIYGMGHAVYSLSDPRAVVFKDFVEKLAHAKGRDEDYALYATIAETAPRLIAEKRKIYKGVCLNVDFYSGFVYSMLGIPIELYTPIFAIARIVGWSAHRLEELINADKIMRPAYRSVMAGPRNYIPLAKRQ